MRSTSPHARRPRPAPRRPALGRRVSAAAVVWAAIVGGSALPAAGQVRRPVVAPRDVNAAARKQRQEEFQRLQQEARDLPALAATRPDDVFRLGLRENRTVTAEVVPGANGRRPPESRYRANLPGVVAGPATVTFPPVSTFQRLGLGGRRNNAFSLRGCEMSTPDALTTVEVEVTEVGTVQVERTTQFDDGQWTVRLTIEPVGSPDDPAAQLFVMRSGGGLTRPETVNVYAADLPALLRDHPRETDAYLRPLLAALGQEQLFAPDLRVAWQVVAADRWPADPGVAAEVAKVLPSLNHPDFHRRDEGLGKLLAMGRPGAAVLRRLDRTGLSAEQHLMVDRALAPYSPLDRSDAARLRADRRFLIDCLCSDDQPTRSAAYDELKQLLRRDDLKFDPAGPTADRLTAVRRLRDDLLPRPTTRPT